MARVGRAVRAGTRASQLWPSPSRNDNSTRGPMMAPAPSSSAATSTPRGHRCRPHRHGRDPRRDAGAQRETKQSIALSPPRTAAAPRAGHRRPCPRRRHRRRRPRPIWVGAGAGCGAGAVAVVARAAHRQVRTGEVARRERNVRVAVGAEHAIRHRRARDPGRRNCNDINGHVARRDTANEGHVQQRIAGRRVARSAHASERSTDSVAGHAAQMELTTDQVARCTRRQGPARGTSG